MHFFWCMAALLLALSVYFMRRTEAFRIQVDADLGGISELHVALKKWSFGILRESKKMAWDAMPYKHLYRKWRRKT